LKRVVVLHCHPQALSTIAAHSTRAPKHPTLAFVSPARVAAETENLEQLQRCLGCLRCLMRKLRGPAARGGGKRVRKDGLDKSFSSVFWCPRGGEVRKDGLDNGGNHCAFKAIALGGGGS
jgi:hypothetical protein